MDNLDKNEIKSISRPLRDHLKPESLTLARLVLDTPGLERSLYMQAIKVLKIAIAKQGRSQGQLNQEKTWDLIDFIYGKIKRGKSLRAAAIEASEFGAPRNIFPLSVKQIENIYKSTPQAVKK